MSTDRYPAGSETRREVKRQPAGQYSSADHERTMVNEMNLHRPNEQRAMTPSEREMYPQRSTDQTGLTASERDNIALRDTIAGKPQRSRTTQAADGTTNEMPINRASEQGLTSQRQSDRQAMMQTEQPVARDHRGAIIPVVPIVPGGGSALGPRDRSSEEVGLRQSAGSELSVADIGPYEPDFRQNYEANYVNSGYGYDQYRPAYQYGFGLAKDPRYTTMDWNELEMQAHRNWNEGTMGPWDRYKDAVRYGWERGREATPGRG
ncbi:MAG: hypothetical protein ABI945_08825 [Nitrospirales bacterium]